MADLPRGLSRLVSELKRRRVFRVAAVYCVVAWLVIQVVVAIFPVLLLPAFLTRAVVALAVLGLPVALVLAWAFDITPEGVRRSEEAPAADAGRRGAATGLRAAFAFLVILVTVGAGWASWAAWLKPRDGETATARAASLDPATVAVLYFDDLSSTGELGYLASGLTEALIHELSQIEALDVISRNGVKPFRDLRIPVDSLARILGAGSLVEGSVEKAGTGLVATVSLVDGGGGETLFSRRMRETGEDVLGLRDRIVAEAARLLGQQLGRGLQVQRQRARTESAEAWRLVQRAEGLVEEADTLRWARGDVESAERTLLRADSLLEGAETADPGWPEPTLRRGWIALKRARLRASSRARYDGERLREGIRHAEEVLRAEPGDPAALELRGTLRYDLSWTLDSTRVLALRKGAEEDLRAAVTADSTRVRAWVGLAQLLRSEGRFSEASLAAERALAADPFLINAEMEILFTLAHVWLELEDLERANRWADAGRRRYPAMPSFAAEKLLILAGWGEAGADADSAWALLSEVERGYGLRDWPYGRLQVAAVLARAELADSARSVIRRVRSEAPEDPWILYYEANARVQLGEREEALDLLARFLGAMPHRRSYIASDWWWRPLREDPRFQALVASG